MVTVAPFDFEHEHEYEQEQEQEQEKLKRMVAFSEGCPKMCEGRKRIGYRWRHPR